MDEMAALWGITKPAFHNLQKTIENFPEPVERKGLTFYYPAFKVVRAMLAYMDRHVRAEKAKAQQFSDLVRPARVEPGEAIEPMTATEQLKAYELRNKLVQEELNQGVLHRADHCAAVSDRVFSLISRTFGSNLADTLDQNGKWPAEVREAVNTAGENLTLRVFNEMKDMLTAGVVGHADGKPPGPSADAKPRGPAGKTRKARKG